jgi:pyrroline-5-carboxylate reductase
MASPSSSASKLKPIEAGTAKIGFLGAGKIAESMIMGLIKYGKVDPNRIHATAVSATNLERLKKEFNIHASRKNIDLFGRYDCDIVFVACPGAAITKCHKLGGQRAAPLCGNYIPRQRHQTVVCSLVSNMPIDKIKKVLLNPEYPDKYGIEWHRMAINTASAYGLGLACVDVDPENQRKLNPAVKEILNTICKLEMVSGDASMDAACALVGAGNAFTYYMLNSMSDGGLKMGLPREIATKFAGKTLLCAAQSVIESGRSPNELKEEVAGPGGAASFGLAKLDAGNVAAGIGQGMEMVRTRAAEMAASSDNKGPN